MKIFWKDNKGRVRKISESGSGANLSPVEYLVTPTEREERRRSDLIQRMQEDAQLIANTYQKNRNRSKEPAFGGSASDIDLARDISETTQDPEMASKKMKSFSSTTSDNLKNWRKAGYKNLPNSLEILGFDSELSNFMAGGLYPKESSSARSLGSNINKGGWKNMMGWQKYWKRKGEEFKDRIKPKVVSGEYNTDKKIPLLEFKLNDWSIFIPNDPKHPELSRVKVSGLSGNYKEKGTYMEKPDLPDNKTARINPNTSFNPMQDYSQNFEIYTLASRCLDGEEPPKWDLSQLKSNQKAEIINSLNAILDKKEG